MDAKTDDKSAGKCPFTQAHTNRDWWPNQLNLQVLHGNSSLSDPMGKEFDYAKEFESLDLRAVDDEPEVAGGTEAPDRESERLAQVDPCRELPEQLLVAVSGRVGAEPEAEPHEPLAAEVIEAEVDPVGHVADVGAEGLVELEVGEPAAGRGRHGDAARPREQAHRRLVGGGGLGDAREGGERDEDPAKAPQRHPARRIPRSVRDGQQPGTGFRRSARVRPHVSPRVLFRGR